MSTPFAIFIKRCWVSKKFPRDSKIQRVNA